MQAFQYAITVVLNHEKTKNHSERLSKINPLLINIIRKR